MNNEKIYVILFTLIITALILVSIGAIVLHQSKQGNIELGSTFDISPSKPAQKATSPEPTVNSWQVYSNQQYNFSLQVPAGWKQQDYAPFYPNGGTVIAFSPDPLPCSTCSYFRNGYFSIKIYNEKTDPEYYSEYTKRIQAMGKDPNYQPVMLHGKQGVAFANTVTVENEGWVYEFSLDKDQGNLKALDSQILQKVLPSFQFTHLLFGS